MPIYQQLGRVPRKRHVAFRKDDGSLHYEELVGNQGFTGPSSLLYHLRLPTAVKSVRPIRGLGWVAEPERVVRHRHFRTSGLATGPSAALDRAATPAGRTTSLPTQPRVADQVPASGAA